MQIQEIVESCLKITSIHKTKTLKSEYNHIPYKNNGMASMSVDGISDSLNANLFQDPDMYNELRRVSLIAENTSNIIVFMDRAGYVTWVNKVFEKITGYTDVEVVGQKLDELLKGTRTNPDTLKYMHQCISDGIGFKTEILYYTRQGQEYWEDLEVIPLRQNSGEIDGFMSIGTNVSNIKMIVSEMLHAQEILRTVLDTAPLHVSVKDAQGKHIFYNKGFENDIIQNGNESDSWLLKKLSSREKRVLALGERYIFEQSLKLGTNYRDFLTFKFPLEDARGNTYAIGRLSFDITDQKLARKALKEREELYFSTLQSISDAVICVDSNFRIQYLNGTAEKLTGYSLRDSKYKQYHEVVMLQDLSSIGSWVNPLQIYLPRHGDTAPTRFMLVSQNQDRVPVAIERLSPMYDSQDQFTGLAIFLHDISDKMERERLEKVMEIKRLTAAIEGQEKERARISKELHDDLGQMLNLIKMKVDTSMDDPQGEISQLIDETIQETAKIAENLIPSKLRDFDLGTALKSLCKQLNNTYEACILFYAFGNMERIDENRKINLYRIAQEAINNALKHAHASLIAVSLNEETDKVQLTVEDNGDGIPPEHHGNHFHHGLTNMRERAKIMNGSFCIESKRGLGTLILVEVPK